MYRLPALATLGWFALLSGVFPEMKIRQSMYMAPEICDNALDDDGDGLVDLNDPDCLCEIAEPISLIPNPSFEVSECCPNTRGNLHCAETWIQASEATTDYLHTCGWFGWEDLPVPMPIPEGEACIGFRNGRFGNNPNPNWKEYTGACLTSPLRAGVSYKFQFWIGFTNVNSSPPINVSFYGSTSCENLPFGIGNERHGCPLNGIGWVLLDQVFAFGANNWIQKEFNITPTQDIYAIAIGPDCLEVSLIDNPYYFLDNLILADVRDFELVIGASSHPCDPNLTLGIPFRDSVHYQWYLDGVALLGENRNQLNFVNLEGSYQLLVQELTGEKRCKITKAYPHYRPKITTSLVRHLCEGDELEVFGRKIRNSIELADTLKTRNNCDSIILTSVIMISDTVRSLESKIFPGETLQVGHHNFSEPMDELVVLNSSHGCDSTVHVQLKYYQVFIPNAISPNNDGLNDQFTIYGSSDLLEIGPVHIFDRWGNLIAEMENLQPNDPVSRLEFPDLRGGMHIYTAKLLMDDGKWHQISGSFIALP